MSVFFILSKNKFTKSVPTRSLLIDSFFLGPQMLFTLCDEKEERKGKKRSGFIRSLPRNKSKIKEWRTILYKAAFVFHKLFVLCSASKSSEINSMIRPNTFSHVSKWRKTQGPRNPIKPCQFLDK